jgi:hypothetical protein
MFGESTIEAFRWSRNEMVMKKHTLNKAKTLLAALILGSLTPGCGSSSSSDSSTSDEQTVGIFLNTEDAYNGYTLYGVIKNTTTYLLDNCGGLVQSWDSDYSTMSAYLLENGNLLHTARLESAENSEFLKAGGDSGRVEIFDSDGELKWYYEVNSSTEFMHHDVEYIESTGTVMVMVWEKHTAAEAKAAGFSGGYALWSEKIIEIDPADDSTIWEWDSWDHMVQEYDEDQDNYAVVADNPQLININYIGDEVEYAADGIHMNSVDYNADLDQIVVSSRNYSEFWIIDHSTSTDEAAAHEGGDQGKGGDILYRWGNPQTYDMGDSGDQKLFFQHDANWVDDDYTDGGQIMVFNNQAGYNDGVDYSTANVIDTGVTSDGSYNLDDDGTYGPDEFTWSYEAEDQTDFYAANISSSRRLPNDNTLITEGTTGRMFEVTYDGEMVWEFINPVDETGVVEQGETPSKNYVFRALRYSPDYVGLDSYDLTSSGDLVSSDYECTIYD